LPQVLGAAIFSKAGANVVESAAILIEFAAVPYER
jgi:hypothetical protein